MATSELLLDLEEFGKFMEDVFSGKIRVSDLDDDEDFAENVVEYEYKKTKSEVVVDTIVNFFKNMKMHSGGSIPQKMLLSKSNIALVLNLDLATACRHVYSRMGLSDDLEDVLEEDDDKSSTETEKLIQLVHNSLYVISKAGVLQEYAPGILLLYLQYCEGIEVL